MINDNIKSDNNTQKTQINRKKLMLIDDSALMRRVVCDIIEKDGRFTVEDICSDGLQAYELLKTKSYDAVLMDIVMPKMTGLELLERLQNEGIGVNAVVTSSLTTAGSKETLKAIQLGAVDYVSKPTNFIEARSAEFAAILIKATEKAVNTPPNYSLKNVKPKPQREELPKHIDATDTVSVVEHYVSGVKTTTEKGKTIQLDESKFRKNAHIGPKAKNKIVAIACSTGGPKALQSVVPNLPANLDAPVLIVQHMPEGFTAMMAQKLDGLSKMHVKEAAEGDLVRKGTIYIAPGGKHMNAVTVGNETRIKLTDEPLREGVKPSANYMYESLRSSSYDEITCVVLTGMGADGTAGIRALAQSNNIYCIAQDAASCVVYGMPKAVYEAGFVNEVVPLTDVVGAIVKNVGVK